MFKMKIPMKECKCGCGKTFPKYRKDGKERFYYLSGHSMRGKTPWNKGKTEYLHHSEETRRIIGLAWKGRKHSFKTKMKLRELNLGEKNLMYGKTGEKCYWYGKHHSDETKSKLRENHIGPLNVRYGKHHDVKTIEKMSNSWTEDRRKKHNEKTNGKPKSETARRNMSRAQSNKSYPWIRTASWRTADRMSDEERKRKSENACKNLAMANYESSQERKMRAVLKLNGIDYEKHKVTFVGNRFHRVDLFIKPNIFVEIDGCYYHGCKQCDKHRKILKYPIPKENSLRDLNYDKNLLKERNYVLLRFWEHEINNDIWRCFKIIRELSTLLEFLKMDTSYGLIREWTSETQKENLNYFAQISVAVIISIILRINFLFKGFLVK